MKVIRISKNFKAEISSILAFLGNNRMQIKLILNKDAKFCSICDWMGRETMKNLSTKKQQWKKGEISDDFKSRMHKKIYLFSKTWYNYLKSSSAL